MEYAREAYLAEIKADESVEGKFTGMASTFGNKDLVNDIIERGAFAKSVKKRGVKRIKLLAYHNENEPIGVFEDIKETDKGLFVEGQLAMGVQKAREMHELMTMGALDSMSIGFRADPSKQQFDDARGVRILKEIDLMEVSIVTFPANERARIRTVKDAIMRGEMPSVREFEAFLRDAGGFSNEVAKAIIAKGYRAAETSERDAVDEEALKTVSKRLSEMFARIGA